MYLPEILLVATLLIQLIVFPKLFEKAGVDKWKGYIPFYNFFAWTKLIKRPFWWAILLFVPGVNLIMLAVMHVELASCFGKRTAKDHVMAIFLPFVFLPMLAKENPAFVGAIDWKAQKKTFAQEWGHAIVFAVVAATIIRTFFIEAYTIPTPSMEKSLLVGDYLFVSKVNYGAKLPNTPVSVPFTHHTLPLTKGTPSYLEWFSLPYLRLPGFGSVERFDPVVFNFPEGDTVLVDMQEQGLNQNARDYASQMRPGQLYSEKSFRESKNILLKNKDWTVRPVDKKDNYIKRCIGLPGDNYEVRQGEVYIDGKKIDSPEKMQYAFNIVTKDRFNLNMLKERYNISPSDVYEYGNNQYNIPCTQEVANQLKATDIVISIERGVVPKGYYANKGLRVFPNHPKYDWSEDNFGPLHLPAKGESLNLTLENLPLYRKAITAYEGNSLEVKNGAIFINDKEVSSYTFKMNYYFMMGDNRHRSADSRMWGMVPEDHIVGKALFIWFSKDPYTGIRWDRIFSLAK